MNRTQIFTDFPEPEKTIIARIRAEFSVSGGPGLMLKECVKDGNPAGYFCDFIYHGFDPRELNARQEPKSAWRKFDVYWRLPRLGSESPFGLFLTFHNGDPYDSEGFSFGSDELPDEVTSDDAIHLIASSITERTD